jgi:poly-gamma-glutamate synthesis protein (capsule biosynthesis protein)
MTSGLGGSADDELVLCAAGEIFFDHPDPDSIFASTAPILRAADITWGDLVGAYAHRPSKPPTAVITNVAHPRNAPSLSRAGFAVMSCATNHTLDGGYEGLHDTLEVLRSQGIAPIGAGLNLEEARRPAILPRKGRRVAFLAYSSVFSVGYEARLDTPGLAPLRFQTAYFPPNPALWQPAAAPSIVTVPLAPDMAAFRQDVARAREQADILVVSFHWGDSAEPVRIEDYQRQLAHEAIDLGADVVWGHHHLSLRGVELYRGKPILYDLGCFALYLPDFEQRLHPAVARAFRSRNEYGFGTREGYPTFPFHPDYRMSAIARLIFRGRDLVEVGLIPCSVEPDGHPEPYSATSERGAEVLEYLRAISAAEGLNTRYEAGGGRSVGGYDAIAVRTEDSA